MLEVIPSNDSFEEKKSDKIEGKEMIEKMDVNIKNFEEMNNNEGKVIEIFDDVENHDIEIMSSHNNKTSENN